MQIKLIPIKRYDTFNNVYQNGKKFYSKNLTSIVIFNENLLNKDKYGSVKSNSVAHSESHNLHYGVTISKRIAKKAVIRNRVKRLLRESMRFLTNTMNDAYFVNVEKIVFSYRLAPLYPKQLSLDEITPAMKHVLEQAYSFCLKSKNK